MEKETKLGKSHSINQIKSKKFDCYALSEEWLSAIGEPEKCFKIFIWGMSGSGKTTFVLKLMKELAPLGKVYYNSYEEGNKKTFQNALLRAELPDYDGSEFCIATDTFDQMMQRLRTNRAKFVVVDSVNAMDLSKKQFETITAAFPKKAFVFIGWATESGHPVGSSAKAIRFWADCKIFVDKRTKTANADSRYGATRPYRIFTDVRIAPGELDLEDSRNNIPQEEAA